MFANNEEMVVGAVSTAMIGFGGLALRKIAAKAAPTVGLALAVVLFVTPQAALADNECGLDDPTVNGSLADSYDCPDADYPEGVTYAADGDLTVNFTNGSLSVIGENPDNGGDDPQMGDDLTDMGGIDLSATGVDSIVFDSAATQIRSNGVLGALLSVTTVDGDIGIDTGIVDADANTPTGVTHGIFTQSTGTGGIDINATAGVDARSNSNPATSIGIEALTGSGAIDLVTGGSATGNRAGIRTVSDSGNVTIETNGTVTGDEYGILAKTGGSGALTITAEGSVTLPSEATENSVAAIDATSGAGLLTVNIGGDAFINAGGRQGSPTTEKIDGGIAIRTNAGGDQVINIAPGFPGGQVRGGIQGMAMDVAAAGTTTINNAGSIIENTSFDIGGAVEVLETEQITAIRAAGGSLTLNNDSTIRGVLDFSRLTEGYVFNNNAGALWRVLTSPTFTVNEGVSELGAGTINNAGTIDFRARVNRPSGSEIPNVDPGTVVFAPGTTFTGTGDSLLEMYAFLDGSGQAGCGGAAADCLDLSGGTTAGRTTIHLQLGFTSLVTGPLTALTSANSGIVLVDVKGGTSEADHFVLDPDSGFVLSGNQIESLYTVDPFYGPVLDLGVGMFDYALLYNPGTQQHVLASVPQRQAIEYVAYIDEATSLWHTTSDAVAGRQADLRDGATGKLWARVVSDSSERDATPTHTSHGNSFEYEHGYSLDSDTLIIGSDWVSGDDHVFGLHVGAVRSRLEFDDSDTRDRSKGAVFGAYGGWWNEAGLSLDGTINANFVKLDHNVSGFENSETSYISFGARVEAGWRLPLFGDPLYVQPLATAAYVTTDFEDLELTDNTIGFEDTTSLRGALGVRLGGETSLNNDRIGKLGYWLTARAWEENADEGEIRFATRDGGHLAIKDDRSGSFEEVNFGVSVSNKDDTLSSYLSGSAVSGDDSDSFNVSIGARLNW